jgi:uncharacterized lipoprotein
MKPRRSNSVIAMLALSAFAVTLAASCASMRASAARSAHIDKMTKQHVYDQPCEQVWPTARQLLFSQGFSVKDTGEGTNRTLETEWAYQGKNSARYLVQGIEPSEEQCKVNFSKNERSSANNQTSSSRDLDIEWNLLKKADPDSAQKIMQEADLKAQAASAS